MPNALAQNGIWWEFTSGTIPITDTTGGFLVVVAVKSTLKCGGCIEGSSL